MMTVFDHVHETVQAVNLQRYIHGSGAFIVEVSTDKKTKNVVVWVTEDKYNRHSADDPKADGKTLEAACKALVVSENWGHWVDKLQKMRAQYIDAEEDRRRADNVKHDARLTKLRGLPIYTVRPGGSAPGDPQDGPSRYDRIAGDEGAM